MTERESCESVTSVELILRITLLNWLQIDNLVVPSYETKRNFNSFLDMEK